MRFKKLTLAQCRKEWTKGTDIYLVPSKVYPNIESMWITPMIFNIETSFEKDIDKIINHFAYYCCSKEVGLRANYYISI